MAKGPLAVHWGDWTLDDPHAGALGRARVELENAGTVTWRDIRLAYHWLDDRGNPIVWDGIRTPLPELAPGERATVDARVRAPIPPGRYRFALDVVADHRAWFSELGSETASVDVDVLPRRGTPRAERPSWVESTAEAEERIAAAHAEGYAVVAGAVEWLGGFAQRRPRTLAPYEPGPGGSRTSPTRSSARPCSTGSSWSGSRTSRGSPPSRRRRTRRGCTTAGSCSRRIRSAARARPVRARRAAPASDRR